MNISSVLDAKGWGTATIEPDVLIPLALQEMDTRNIGALVVTRDGDNVLGVISERDVTRALVRYGCDLLTMRVEDVMARPVPVCAPDEGTDECMLTMTQSRHRHLPVVDDGVLLGLVSIGDLVKNRLQEVELERAAIESERDVLRRYFARTALGPKWRWLGGPASVDRAAPTGRSEPRPLGAPRVVSGRQPRGL
jgi:CBS domain-containing protein